MSSRTGRRESDVKREMFRAAARRLWPAPILAAALLAPMPAQAMTADEFLTRAMALKAKGMMAVFQKKEIGVLVDEAKSAGEAYKVDYDKAKATGDTSALGCPPAPGSAAAKDKKNRMSTEQFLAHFSAIPKEQRQRMSFKTAYYDLIRTRYPCR